MFAAQTTLRLSWTIMNLFHGYEWIHKLYEHLKFLFIYKYYISSLTHITDYSIDF